MTQEVSKIDNSGFTESEGFITLAELYITKERLDAMSDVEFREAIDLLLGRVQHDGLSSHIIGKHVEKLIIYRWFETAYDTIIEQEEDSGFSLQIGFKTRKVVFQ